MSEDAPVVVGEVDAARRQVKIRCPHCGRGHYHGLGEGHRVAHCVSSDLPKEKRERTLGYVIKYN